MKRKIALLTLALLLLLALPLSFTSCGEEEVTECTSHVDANRDKACDNCGDAFIGMCTDHTNSDDDGKCDYCGILMNLDDPTTDDPTTDDPTTDDPTTDDPTTDDPTTDDPTTDEPTTDDPTTDDPTTDDPTTDDPTTDDPTTDDPTTDEPTVDDGMVSVTVPKNDGYTVSGMATKRVNPGESVSFKVTMKTVCDFVSVSHGAYDPETSMLTIDNVTEDITVKFNLLFLGYDKNDTCAYVFRAASVDTSSVEPSGAVNLGTSVKVESLDKTRIFVGWSFGNSVTAGGEIISTERVLTFRITPDIMKGTAIYVYANYKAADTYYYDVNGGIIDTGSRNLAENEYYTATVDGERITVVMLDKYLDFAKSACTFWDDSTFTRDGYVLKEYNTMPDGSGEGYSLGSKFFPAGETDYPTLYCIWEAAEQSDLFVTEAFSMKNPATKAEFAPDWKTDGLVIKSYTGSAKKLTIPEYIDGKAVIAIAEGAFVNCDFETLIFPKTLQKVENGAFNNCSSLKTLYFPSSMYEMYDEAFDESTYSSFTTFIVNATMAPRHSHTTEGAFAVKLSRVLANPQQRKVIVISGSSTYQSMGTGYFEALLGDDFSVINFGTTRPRPGMIYLEALSHYTDDDDVFIYAPENSAYMFGEKYISWRMIRDLEGMNNLYRYFDISNYEGYFSSLTEVNRDYNYTVQPRRFEEFVNNGSTKAYTDKNGDYQNENRANMDYDRYTDTYFITLNNRVKSITEGIWNDESQQVANKDYKDPNNTTWISIDTPERVAQLNMAINKAKSTGAKVYFGFAPVDEYAVVEEAKNREWVEAYEKLIDDLYDFDGNLGRCEDYIMDHKYFYDCAFHANDYGRAYRTYQMYLDLSDILGIENKREFFVGNYSGCQFEKGSVGTPLITVEWLAE